MTRKPRSVNNILCFRNDRLGEFLLTIPAIKALKDACRRECRLTAVVGPALAELAGSIDSIDDVVVWENRRHSFREMIGFACLLRQRKFDLSIVFNPSKESNLLSFFAGIPRRVGYRRKLGFLLTDTIEDRKHLAEKHEVEYNLELAKLAGAHASDVPLRLQPGKGLSAALDKTLERGERRFLVALHPWTSDSLKQWPLERFTELSRRLTDELDVRVVIVGGGENASLSRRTFTAPERSGIADLTARTSLRELAAILQKCDLLVSGDSGPVHLAAAVGTPVIAIFRTDLPGKGSKRWGPWGGPHAVIEGPSLEGIAVQEVFVKAKEMLWRRAAG